MADFLPQHYKSDRFRPVERMNAGLNTKVLEPDSLETRLVADAGSSQQSRD